MVAYLNRQYVQRAHQLKRYDKRHPQVGVVTPAVPAAATPNKAPVEPPPGSAPAPASLPPVTTVVFAPATVAKPEPTPSNGSSNGSSAATAKSSSSSTTRSSRSVVPFATGPLAKPFTTLSATPSASPSLGGASGATFHKAGGLSGGGVAGLVIGILLALITVIVFVTRRRSIMRRKEKRTWDKGLFPQSEATSEKAEANLRTSQYAFQGHAGPPIVPALTPPSASYNNPVCPISPSVASGGRIISTHSPADQSGKHIAIIRCTFIPTLPDELSITIGEIVTIINPFDDGWALCANGRGEEGMVPLECLEKDITSPSAPESDWKNAQRASSLIFRDGVRY